MSRGRFEAEVASGRRFRFGRNWRGFLDALTDERIALAEASLREMLDAPSLAGRAFLDVGAGSGLFSLAARRLGASVRSFDYDPEAVACVEELRARHFPDDPAWEVREGSALDRGFLDSLGTFDVVYAWGSLHCTGDMWTALDNAQALVAGEGNICYIAIHNDQGWRSAVWRRVKQCYCRSAAGRLLVTGAFIPLFALNTCLRSVVKRRNLFREYAQRRRGMSMVHDWRDWLGGLPYETATVEAVTRFMAERGFRVERIRATTSHGCNEFVFRRER